MILETTVIYTGILTQLAVCDLFHINSPLVNKDTPPKTLVFVQYVVLSSVAKRITDGVA